MKELTVPHHSPAPRDSHSDWGTCFRLYRCKIEKMAAGCWWMVAGASGIDTRLLCRHESDCATRTAWEILSPAIRIASRSSPVLCVCEKKIALIMINGSEITTQLICIYLYWTHTNKKEVSMTLLMRKLACKFPECGVNNWKFKEWSLNVNSLKDLNDEMVDLATKLRCFVSDNSLGHSQLKRCIKEFLVRFLLSMYLQSMESMKLSYLLLRISRWNNSGEF